MYSTKLADGSEPTVLRDRLTKLLTEHGYRRVGVDWWTHSETGVGLTVGFSSRAYRLRAFPPGQRVGPPVEVIEMSRYHHLGRAADLLNRWTETDAPYADWPAVR